MNKKLLSFLLSLLLLIAISVPATANDPTLPRIIDDAWLLTDAENAALTEQAYALRTEYDMDVIILTVDSLDGKTARAYADDYYDQHGYGVGADYSGVLLLLAMDSREWYISTCGEAIYAITDYGIQALFNRMSAHLSDGDYYRAFSAYLQALDEHFEAYRQGSPIDGYNPNDSYDYDSQDEVVYYPSRSHFDPRYILTALIIGLVTAGVTVAIMAGSMNTKKRQSGAMEYMRRDTYHLRTHRDMFLYSRLHKTPRPKDTGGGSHSGGRRGGSSVHRSSSGRRHGGGGGRF